VQFDFWCPQNSARLPPILYQLALDQVAGDIPADMKFIYEVFKTNLTVSEYFHRAGASYPPIWDEAFQEHYLAGDNYICSFSRKTLEHSKLSK